MPIDAAQLLEAPPLAACVELPLLLLALELLLLLLPQPAATSAVSVMAARLMRTFIGAGTSSSGGSVSSFGQDRGPGIGRGAVRVVRRRRRAGRPEHGDQAHLVPAGVLQTVNGARRQLDT